MVFKLYFEGTGNVLVNLQYFSMGMLLLQIFQILKPVFNSFSQAVIKSKLSDQPQLEEQLTILRVVDDDKLIEH